MKRKLLAVLLLTALVVGGASAQLMFGVTGAIPTGTSNFTFNDVATRLQNGEGVFYGVVGELAFRKLGFGFAVNTMTMYSDYWAEADQIMDGAAFVSFHLIKARAFLDPFVELGGGLVATMNPNDMSGYTPFYDASYYWYAAAGLGVNLGIVGVFAKFAYNFAVQEPVMWEDAYGDSYAYSAFGYRLYGTEIELPPYKLTVGAKIIL